MAKEEIDIRLSRLEKSLESSKEKAEVLQKILKDLEDMKGDPVLIKKMKLQLDSAVLSSSKLQYTIDNYISKGKTASGINPFGGLDTLPRHTTNFNELIGKLGLLNVGMKALDFAVNKAIEAYKELVEEEIINARLTEEVNSKFKDSVEILERLNKQSSELSKKTLFSDEDIKDVQTLALNLDYTEDGIIRIVKASTQLAQFKNIPISQAFEMLNQSVDGNVKALAKMYPELRRMSSEQLKAGGAIDVVSSKLEKFDKIIENSEKNAWSNFGTATTDFFKGLWSSITGIFNTNIVKDFINEATTLVKVATPGYRDANATDSLDVLELKLKKAGEKAKIAKNELDSFLNSSKFMQKVSFWWSEESLRENLVKAEALEKELREKIINLNKTQKELNTLSTPKTTGSIKTTPLSGIQTPKAEVMPLSVIINKEETLAEWEMLQQDIATMTLEREQSIIDLKAELHQNEINEWYNRELERIDKISQIEEQATEIKKVQTQKSVKETQAASKDAIAKKKNEVTYTKQAENQKRIMQNATADLTIELASLGEALSEQGSKSAQTWARIGVTAQYAKAIMGIIAAAQEGGFYAAPAYIATMSGIATAQYVKSLAMIGGGGASAGGASAAVGAGGMPNQQTYGPNSEYTRIIEIDYLRRIAEGTEAKQNVYMDTNKVTNAIDEENSNYL